MGRCTALADTRLIAQSAVKVLRIFLCRIRQRQRFEREARAVSSLSHPHICALYDGVKQDGIDYLVMEYIEGDRLQTGSLKTSAS